MPIPVLLLTSLFLATGRFDKWPPPRPTLFDSPNMLYGLLDTPPNYFGERAKSKATFFRRAGSKRVALWSRVLENEPELVLISDAGHVASIDCYGMLGSGDVVVIYGGRGQTLSRYRLTDLFTREEVLDFEKTVSSTHWANYSASRFVNPMPASRWELDVVSNPGIRSKKPIILRFDPNTGKLIARTVPAKKR